MRQYTGRKCGWPEFWRTGSAVVGRASARYRMSHCHRSEHWASAYSGTACSAGETCSPRGSRRHLVDLLKVLASSNVRPARARGNKGNVGARPALACAFNRVSMSNMSCTRWNPVAEKMQHTFGRQALPIVWDFAEVAITAEAPGNWKSGYKLIADVVDVAVSTTCGEIQPADATQHPLPDQSASVWFTDPPYYDAVPYADLSDFFLVWLKRVLPDHPLLRDLFDATNPLSPKIREAVQDETKQEEGRPKDRAWFEETMARAFAEGRRGATR